VIKASEQIVFRDETMGFERHLLAPTFPVKRIEFIYKTIPKDSPGIEILRTSQESENLFLSQKGD